MPAHFSSIITFSSLLRVFAGDGDARSGKNRYMYVRPDPWTPTPIHLQFCEKSAPFHLQHSKNRHFCASLLNKKFHYHPEDPSIPGFIFLGSPQYRLYNFSIPLPARKLWKRPSLLASHTRVIWHVSNPFCLARGFYRFICWSMCAHNDNI